MLIAALHDDWVDWAAAESLGRIGDARAIGPLISMLVSTSEVMRRAALKALEAIEPEWTTTQDARDAVPFVLAALNYEDENSLITTEEVRCAAIDTLARIGDARAVVPLLRKLEEWTLGSRESFCVIKALGTLRDPRGVRPLTGILLRGFRPGTLCIEGCSDVQCVVVTALGDIGDKAAVEALLLALCLEPVGNGNSRSFGLELAPERGGFHECATTTLHYGPEGNHSQEVSGR
jgi:HEAT repeat protein